MGAWSTSITGNDTAEDLQNEYQAAFYYNDITTALSKIDTYVKKDGFDESIPNDWCDYYYSLANFMWNKGILTDIVKNEALRLIDASHGIEVWTKAGEKKLNERKKVLQKFRDKLNSPQPTKKKIKLDMYTKPIFEVGDIIAFQLQTLNKRFIEPNDKNNWQYKITEEDFYKLNGKYLVIRKVADRISYTSRIEEKAKDIWPVFELYNEIFDEIPKLDDIIELDVVNFSNGTHLNKSFYCEGNMFYFRKRKSIFVGNVIEGIEKPLDSTAIFLKDNIISADLYLVNVLSKTTT